MTKSAEKRKRLFDIYSQNWVHYSTYLNLPDSWVNKKIYACPMCLSAFDESGLDQTLEHKLTLEDVPPKKLGGKPVILTCNKCNNQSGTGLDAHLLNQTRAVNVLTGKLGGSKEAVIQINEGSIVTGKIENLPNNVLGIRLYNKSNPNAQKDFDNLVKNWNQGKIKFNITGGNPRRFEVAKLRIAYLLAFAKFGFGFVLNRTMEPIRQQVLNPTENILDHLGIAKLDFEFDSEGIYLIKEPKELISYLAVFNIIEQGHRSQVSVILPSPHPNSFSIYEEMKLKSKLTRIQLDKIPNLPFLTKPEFSTASKLIWMAFKYE